MTETANKAFLALLARWEALDPARATRRAALLATEWGKRALVQHALGATERRVLMFLDSAVIELDAQPPKVDLMGRKPAHRHARPGIRRESA